MTLKEKFTLELYDAIEIGKSEIDYDAKCLKRMLNKYRDGVQVAKKLIVKEPEPEGFERLRKEDRLALSIEALVIKQKYRKLFTEAEVVKCQKRLEKYGYFEHSREEEALAV